MITREVVSNDDFACKERLNELVELNNSLKDLGSDTDLCLPGIVVIGNQSAGKSSIIEAIMGIPLPCSDGTCTRCPIECRMLEVSGAPWSCQVALKYMYDDNGNELPYVENYKFGEEIFDVAEVEERVKRAQKAILNRSLKMKF